MKILKHVIAFVAGLFAMQVLVMGVQTIGHKIWAPAEGCAYSLDSMFNPDSMEACMAALPAYIETAPFGALLFPFISYFFASMGAGLVAAKLAPSHGLRYVWTFAILTLLGGVVTMTSLPMPAWAWVAGIVAPIAGAWVAKNRLAG
jgi:hypothetical protein